MPYKCYTKQDYYVIAKLRDEGLSLRAIGEQLGMNKNSVAMILRNFDKLPEKLGERNAVYFEHDRYYRFY